MADVYDIYIDTNILQQHGWGTSFDWQVLVDFTRRSADAQLWISEVVVAEVKHKFRESIANKAKTIIGDMEQLGRFMSRSDIHSKELSELNVEEESDIFIDRLTRRAGVSRLPLPSVTHEQLLARCMAGKRPFISLDSPNRDKGWRDSLIWESILERVRQHPERRVVIVTGNTSDFAQDKTNPNVLHSDLADEAKAAGSKHLIELYSRLDNFVNGIPKDRNARLDALVQRLNENDDFYTTLVDENRFLLVDAIDGYLAAVGIGQIPQFKSVFLYDFDKYDIGFVVKDAYQLSGENVAIMAEMPLGLELVVDVEQFLRSGNDQRALVITGTTATTFQEAHVTVRGRAAVSAIINAESTKILFVGVAYYAPAIIK